MLYLLSQRYHWKHLKVASQLEDSLTVAASALALVKSVEPNIITIQVNNIITNIITIQVNKILFAKIKTL